jgi:hypothetical protein
MVFVSQLVSYAFGTDHIQDKTKFAHKLPTVVTFSKITPQMLYNICPETFHSRDTCHRAFVTAIKGVGGCNQDAQGSVVIEGS